MSSRKQFYSEEVANTISHVLGILFCLIAIPIALVKAYNESSLLITLSILVFGIGLLLVYTFSSIYHIAQNEKLKKLLNIGDHISIYFLIAGTYTPIIYMYLPYNDAFNFLSIMWGIVLFGLLFKAFFKKRFEWFSLILYLVMGWMLMFVIKPLNKTMPSEILGWIMAGGISYTLGVYFYIKDNKPYFHTIWHIFVLLGSVLHFIAVYKSI